MTSEFKHSLIMPKSLKKFLGVSPLVLMNSVRLQQGLRRCKMWLQIGSIGFVRIFSLLKYFYHEQDIEAFVVVSHSYQIILKAFYGGPVPRPYL